MKWKILFVSLIIFVIGGGLYKLLYSRPIIPNSIAAQMTITPLLATGNGLSIVGSSVKYDASEKIFSYVTKYKNDSITISEQPEPNVFNDLPDYYSTWLNSLGQYASFSSVLGNVNLAQSSKLGSNDVAILTSDGTLLFARPALQLSENDWRTFFFKRAGVKVTLMFKMLA